MQVLLVEGDADKRFYGACCRKAGLSHKIEISPPRDLGVQANGKGHAIALLPALVKQLEDGTYTSLGIVLDADYENLNGLGFNKTWARVAAIFKGSGYTVPDKPGHRPGGYLFEHPDGLPRVGLWIMPDNKNPGFLEDFIKSSVRTSEASLLNDAKTAVQNLKLPKFAVHHKSKAEVSTWLAWQKTPGQALVGAVGAELLEFNKLQGESFCNWLREVFPKP